MQKSGKNSGGCSSELDGLYRLYELSTSHMTFTILGSGTHFPDPAKRSAGYLFQNGKDLALFDFGYGTLLRLAEFKVRYQDIGHIFFTHLHEDHYLDFLPFLNTLYLQVASWGLSRRTLRLYGPRGFKKKLEGILDAVGFSYAPHVKLIFQELTRSRIKASNTVIMSHPVHHADSISALCYRIQGRKGDLAYTGDLDYDEKIIPFLKGVKTLVIECGFPELMKRSGHLIPSEAGALAEQACARQVILTHRYPPCDTENIMAQCRREYRGKIIVARDGLALIG